MNKLFRFAYILWEYRSVLLTTIHKDFRGKPKNFFTQRRKILIEHIKHHKSLLNYKQDGTRHN